MLAAKQLERAELESSVYPPLSFKTSGARLTLVKRTDLLVKKIRKQLEIPAPSEGKGAK